MKAIIAALACLALTSQLYAADEAPPQRLVAVVLPFKTIANDASRNWVADAIRENIQSELLRARAAALVAPPVGAPRVGPVDTVDAAIQAGKAADAILVIYGSVQVNDTDIRVTAHLVDVPTAKSIGSIKASGTLRQLFELEDQLTAQMFDIIGTPPTEPAPQRVATPDPGAAPTEDLAPYRQVGPDYTPLDDQADYTPVYQYPSYAWGYDTYAYTPAYVSWYPWYVYTPTCYGIFVGARWHHHDHDHDWDHGHGHRPVYTHGGHSHQLPVVRPRPHQQGGGHVVINDRPHDGRPHYSARAPLGTLVANPGRHYLDPVSQAPNRPLYNPWPRPQEKPAVATRDERPSRSVITLDRRGNVKPEASARGDRPDRSIRVDRGDSSDRPAGVTRREIRVDADRPVAARTPRSDPSASRGDSPRSRDIVIRSADPSPSRSSSASPGRSFESARSSAPARSADTPRSSPAPSAPARSVDRPSPPSRSDSGSSRSSSSSSSSRSDSGSSSGRRR